MLPLLLIAFLQGDAPREAPVAAREIDLPLRVNRAIALGVGWLRRIQNADGSFPGYEGEHPGGATAFATYTLAKSGVRRDDPALRRALTALAYTEFKSTYSASAHVLMCEALRDPALALAAKPSLEFLLSNQQEGVWAYPWSHLCDSNTQFALLALRAARRLGLEVPEDVLVDALDGLSVFRHSSGGFTYAPADNTPYAGITAAALASLAVLQEAAADMPRLRSALDRSGSMRTGAERWLEERFDPQRNLQQDGSWRPAQQYAYLWALERWCGLTERERIAGRDWYTEGATWLVDVQNRDGSFGFGRQLPDTCFALLFLRRATVTANAELDELDAEIDRQRAERPERPFRPDDGALRLTEWWLAGPWDKRDEVLLLEPPFDPADVRPSERGKLARRDWERVTLLPQRWTDLEKLTNRAGNKRLWALATWLSAPGDRPLDVWLWLEVDDGWDVLLDGVRLSRERRRTGNVTSDVRIPLRLTPGEHLLTVLVEDHDGPTGFGALLSDSRGDAPPGGLHAIAEPSDR